MTAEDETFDVRPGSLVFFADPAVRRAAIATEADTVLLTIGAPAGAAFTPSEWEARWARELGVEPGAPTS